MTLYDKDKLRSAYDDMEVSSAWLMIMGTLTLVWGAPALLVHSQMLHNVLLFFAGLSLFGMLWSIGALLSSIKNFAIIGSGKPLNR